MERWLLPPVIFLVSLFSSCSKPGLPAKTAVVEGAQDIRSIDFRNFDYPKIPGEIDTEIHLRNGIHKNLFRHLDPEAEEDLLSNGEAWLEQVTYNYGDDGKPIAIVVLSVNAGGTMNQSEILLYEWKEGQPQLNWSFETGDRADGGLRTLYFESGHHNLVVELYEEGADDPLCCASHFKRDFYNWKNGQFMKLGSEDWIPLSKESRRLIAHSTR